MEIVEDPLETEEEDEVEKFLMTEDLSGIDINNTANR